MKRFYPLLQQFWRPILIGLLMATATFFILFQNLGTRPAYLSAPEVTTRNASSSLHVIWKSPIDSPLTIPEHLAIHFSPKSVIASRIIPAIYGVVALLLFFGIVRFWQNSFTAVVATVMLGTSAWFLHVARLDTPGVLMFGVLGLMACGLWLKHTLHRNLLLLLAAAAAATAFYIPGLIWFVVGGIIGTRKSILHEVRHIKFPARVLAVILAGAMLFPIARSLAHQPSLIWSVLGLPQHFPAVTQWLKNLVEVPVHIFAYGPSDPVRWLGHLPILNVFETVMVALGAYAFWHYRQLDRTRLLLGWAVIGLLLISTAGPVTFTILLPLLYIIIAAGVFYLLEAWFKVFPNNPVARGTGIVIVLATVAISCYYQYTSYFGAWQNSPATRAIFTQRPTKL